jgi:hypothetical protein
MRKGRRGIKAADAGLKRTLSDLYVLVVVGCDFVAVCCGVGLAVAITLAGWYVMEMEERGPARREGEVEHEGSQRTYKNDRTGTHTDRSQRIILRERG